MLPGSGSGVCGARRVTLPHGRSYSGDELDAGMKRFERVFHFPQSLRVLHVPGNHDLGVFPSSASQPASLLSRFVIGAVLSPSHQRIIFTAPISLALLGWTLGFHLDRQLNQFPTWRCHLIRSMVTLGGSIGVGGSSAGTMVLACASLSWLTLGPESRAGLRRSPLYPNRAFPEYYSLLAIPGFLCKHSPAR